MPTSTRSTASKTCSGLTCDTVPSKKTRKCQLSNPEDVKQPTKKGKKKHDDSGNDNNSNSNDDNDNKGEGDGNEVTDDRKEPKRTKRAAKVAKKKALDQMRKDALASTAPLLKKLPQSERVLAASGIAIAPPPLKVSSDPASPRNPASSGDLPKQCQLRRYGLRSMWATAINRD